MEKVKNTIFLVIYDLKEYYFNRLVFEGEYVNGQKNGKGKEYDWVGNVIFEGEYLNGVRVYK